MKKIYEANVKEIIKQIEIDNNINAFDIQKKSRDLMGINDLVMIGRTNEFPVDNNVDVEWSLNGLLINEKNGNGDILIIEPLIEQINNVKLIDLNESKTKFDGPIELSSRAIILMSLEKYEKLCQNEYIKNRMEEHDVRLYKGEEKDALKMVLHNKRYIYIDVTENGFLEDKENYPDLIEYGRILSDIIKGLNEQIKTKGKIEIIKEKREIKGYRGYKDNSSGENFKMISGLTKKIEGEIELGDDMFAATNIGKVRDNQEDAILLIKHKYNPKFKMIVLADGIGGGKNGEIASDVVVTKLKEWFDNLTPKQMKCYHTGLVGLQAGLQDNIERELQIEVEYQTGKLGGTTLVCAIFGENDTLIANVGDSRAYIVKDGRLIQISREDTVAKRNLEEGKTKSKEASRFDSRANELTQAIGMSRKDLKHPHFEIINNDEYDMIVLFSDGVTDCLSDEDIAVICRKSNRKDFAKKIVEKAMKHDSIRTEEIEKQFERSIDSNVLILGGKDNTSAVVGFNIRD